MANINSFKLFHLSISELLSTIGLSPKLMGKSISIPLKTEHKLFWKNKEPIATLFEEKFKKVSSVKVSKNEIKISSNDKSLKSIRSIFEECCELIQKENIFSEYLWSEVNDFCSPGFDDTQNSLSKEQLKDLYKDAYIVAEKKPFVIDLKRSKEARMISIGKNPMSFFDGAAQIASLALGYNNIKKNPLFLKPELLENSQNVEGSDIYNSFVHLLKNQSGLANCYVVNSGAEAVETSLKACQIKYPTRSKVIAFKGSFHGRTLLALHCTYNPAKRIPYELFPDLVHFLEFPEDKEPDIERHESENWLKLWSTTNDSEFATALDKIEKDVDDVIEKEIIALTEIRDQLKQGNTLAMISEPMLCEGGDRYGSDRFFRALRVLTRSFDTPLIMDEVQTGFGLGGPFFWHKKFQFQKTDGSPDHPDCVCVAKKAQAAACITHFEIKDHKVESSYASLYRGYIQGQEVLRSDILATEKKSKRFLRLLNNHLAKDSMTYPRAMGLAFAFDVATADIAKALVGARFRNGLLFYPAGDKTLRFRMLLKATDKDYAELFTGIRKCFLELEEKGELNKGKSLDEWNKELSQYNEFLSQTEITQENFFTKANIPSDIKDIKNLNESDWVRVFRTLTRHIPQLLYSPHNLKYTLKKLNSETLSSLWKTYENTTNFTIVDFLWQASRLMGTKILEISTKELKEYSDQITHLEETVYEPARRGDISNFLKYSKKPNSIFLVALDKNDSNKITALSVLAPLNMFENVGLIDTDPDRLKAKYLYSADLTVDPSHQGQGLGYRLKCEQVISAWAKGALCIKSRNRFPESSGMIKLNQRLGSVVTSELKNAYGNNSAPAKYQSLKLPSKNHGIRIADERLPALQNKGSLANFISPSYIRNMLVLKEVLPKKHQHVYLASGTAEAVDKIVKLLKEQRQDAKICLSITNDYFGNTTASSRSLGGNGVDSFFDWPSFDLNEKLENIEEFINSYGRNAILGFFVEPLGFKNKKKKEAKKLQQIIKLFKSYKIPVVLHETASSFGNYTNNKFIVGDQFDSDISFLHAAPQLAVIACQKQYFNDKPLMMISTWDGDETGLHLLRNKIENWAWKGSK